MRIITLLLVLVLCVPAYGQMLQTGTAADSLFDLLVGKTGSQLGSITAGVTNIGSKTYWDEHAYEYIERLVGKLDQVDSITMVSNNIINAQWFDSLETAFDYFSANIDTGILYIPAGEYTIYDSLALTYLRPGRAFWGVYGDPGGTHILADTTGGKFDSTMNMINVTTSGVTDYNDSCIAFLDISGINFDHQMGGGTRFYWSVSTSDSGGHALRTWRWETHDMDPWPESGESAATYAAQWAWVDAQGWIIRTFGRIWTLSLSHCRFENSNGGAIRQQDIRWNNAWAAGVEGGYITHNTFHTIRGCAIAVGAHAPNTIDDNYFRWVGVGVYCGAGGMIIQNSRVEEYDSCFVFLDDANWCNINGNVISEGAQAAIRISGSSGGSITNNTFINVIADDAYQGSQWSSDTVAAVIEIEAYNTASTSKFPRGVVIANNYWNTHSSYYDTKTSYFIEAVYDGVMSGAVSSAVDSVYGNVITGNVCGYGRGTDRMKGFTNLSTSRNIIKDNICLDSSATTFNTSSEWIIGTGTGTFTTTATNDTVAITGATANDKYIITPYGSTAADSSDVLTAYAKTDTLIVLRPAGGTSGLTYRYLRIK